MITFCNIISKCRNRNRNQFSFNYRSLLVLVLHLTVLPTAFVLQDATANASSFIFTTEAAVRKTTISDDNSNHRLNEITVPITKGHIKTNTLDDFKGLIKKSPLPTEIDFHNENNHNAADVDNDDLTISFEENNTEPLKYREQYNSIVDHNELDVNKELQWSEGSNVELPLREHQQSVISSRDSFVWKVDPLRDAKLDRNEIVIDSNRKNRNVSDSTVKENEADVKTTEEIPDYKPNLKKKETEISEAQDKKPSFDSSEFDMTDNNVDYDDKILHMERNMKKSTNFNAHIENQITKKDEISSNANLEAPIESIDFQPTEEYLDFSTTNLLMETTEQMMDVSFPDEKHIEIASDRTNLNVFETTEHVTSTDSTQSFEFTTKLYSTTLSVLNAEDNNEMTEIPLDQFSSNYGDDEVSAIKVEESILQSTTTSAAKTTQQPQTDSESISVKLFSKQNNFLDSTTSTYISKMDRKVTHVTEDNSDVSVAEIEEVLPSRFTFKEHFRIHPFLLLLICSISGLFVLLSAIIYLINFQRQHGTLDIELHERRCGKDNSDEPDYEKRITLLDVELSVDYPKLESETQIESDERLLESDKK